MANDNEFIPGLLAKAPHSNAPDFVKCGLSVKVAELRAYLDTLSDEWLNIDVKEAKSGKWYAAKNAFKPEGKGKPAPRQPASASSARSTKDGVEIPLDDDIPF